MFLAFARSLHVKTGWELRALPFCLRFRLCFYEGCRKNSAEFAVPG